MQMFSEVFIHHLSFLAAEVVGCKPTQWQKLPKEQNLFCHPNGRKVVSLRNGFESLMADAKSDEYPDGLKMIGGKSHTLSSFRHTYASLQIESGATSNGLGFLAANMGTSEEMLRKHYAQILHELRSDELQMI